MHQKSIEQLKQKSQKLQQQLCEIGPIMRGSVVLIGTKNKQYYFSLNKDKKRSWFISVQNGSKWLGSIQKITKNYYILLRRLLY